MANLPAKGEQKPSKHRKALWTAVNLVAWVVWAFISVKLFIGDIDRWVVESVTPGIAWLLDYRGLFVFVAIAALLVLTRIKAVGIAMLYVAFFPFVVVFYKIPRRLYRIRSWTVAMGFLHATLATVRSIRFVVAMVAALLLAMFVLRLSSDPIWLSLCLVAFSGIWLTILFRAIRYSLTTNRFLRSQENLLQRALHSSILWSLVAVKDNQRAADDNHPLDQQSSSQVIQQIGLGVVLYRAVFFWADRLDKYRKSSASIAFGCAAIVALFIEAAGLFSLINITIYKIDPQQFTTSGKPSLALVVYYTVASFFASEVAAMVPAGGLAYLVRIFAVFSVAVIALILIATLILGVKQARDAESANDTLTGIRYQAELFGGRLEKEYEEPILGLIERIRQAGWDLVGLLDFFSSVLDRSGRDDEIPPK